MKISVITVCYNAATTIADSLISVREQSYPDIEHIVIDGQSADGTQAIVEQHQQRISRFVSEPDRGLYDAMNKGMTLASGDVIAFLNADDIYVSPQVLSNVAEVMSDPTLDACYANLFYVDPVDTQRVVRVWKSRAFKPGLFKRGWMPAHPTLFVRRAALLQTGGFNLQFPRQGDFDLTMRLFEQQRIRSRYVPEYWVQMRAGGLSNSGWRNVLRGNLEAYRICRHNGLKVTPFFIFIKIISRLNQFWYRRDNLPVR